MCRYHNYNTLPKILRIQFIKNCLTEKYPFSDEDIEFYKDFLDFKILSYNTNIKWSYHLLKAYIDRWDWNHIESNMNLRNEINLPLLFPDKVSYKLAPCSCNRKLDFCEQLQYCPRSNEKPIIYSPRKEIIDVVVYQIIEELIIEGTIDDSVVLKVFLLDADIILDESNEVPF